MCGSYSPSWSRLSNRTTGIRGWGSGPDRSGTQLHDRSLNAMYGRVGRHNGAASPAEAGAE